MSTSEIFAFLNKISLARLRKGVEELLHSIAKFFFIFLGVFIFQGFPQGVANASSNLVLSSYVLDTVGENSLSEVRELLANRKWNEAVPLLRVFLKTFPNSVPATLGLATALTHLGRREEALDILIKATSWAKGSQREVFVRRIRVLTRLFLTNKIFQLYQDGLNFVFTKKYRSARERFELALTDEPENVEILIRLGQSLILDGDFKRGLEPLTAAKKLNPFEPEVSLWLGRALLQQGSFSDAVIELRIANEGLKDSEQAPIWLAESLLASGQLVSAIRILDHDVKVSPFHLLSLVSAAKYRLQAPHIEYPALLTARKSLQLALSRLSKYPPNPEGSGETFGMLPESSLGLNRSPPELKGEIQRLLQQVESRFNEMSTKR